MSKIFSSQSENNDLGSCGNITISGVKKVKEGLMKLEKIEKLILEFPK